MEMFRPILSRIPKNRSELVNDFEIPDIPLSPYLWEEPEELIFDSDSCLTMTELCDDKVVRVRRDSLSTDSSPPLSRAMTDSEIDYDRYKRIKSRRQSDPWWQLKQATDLFPPDYIESLNSFQSTSSDSTSTSTRTPRSLSPIRLERQQHYEELRQRVERYLDEECRYFSPGDPGLVALEDALQSIDMAILDQELDNEYIGF